MAKADVATMPAAKKFKPNPTPGSTGGVIARQRASYSLSFKMEVVRMALQLPASARIKPTCRAYPGIEPVQIRKWIRNFTPLIEQEAGENNLHSQHASVASAAAHHRLHLPPTAPGINYRRLALAGAGSLPGHAAHLSSAAGLTSLAMSPVMSPIAVRPSSNGSSPAPGSPIASAAPAMMAHAWAAPTRLGAMASFGGADIDQRLDAIDRQAAKCWRGLGSMDTTVSAQAHLLHSFGGESYLGETLARADTSSSFVSLASTAMWPNGFDSSSSSARGSPAMNAGNNMVTALSHYSQSALAPAGTGGLPYVVPLSMFTPYGLGSSSSGPTAPFVKHLFQPVAGGSPLAAHYSPPQASSPVPVAPNAAANTTYTAPFCGLAPAPAEHAQEFQINFAEKAMAAQELLFLSQGI